MDRSANLEIRAPPGDVCCSETFDDLPSKLRSTAFWVHGQRLVAAVGNRARELLYAAWVAAQHDPTKTQPITPRMRRFALISDAVGVHIHAAHS